MHVVESTVPEARSVKGLHQALSSCQNIALHGELYRHLTQFQRLGLVNGYY